MRNIRSSYGFTIVEIIIVITVISIISAVGIIGFGSWRESIAKAEVKSDLSNAAAAMKNELNYNNAYPLSLPTTYKSSKNVTVTYRSGDTSSFCIEAASTVIPSIVFFVNSTSQRQPAEGTCDGGTTTPPVIPPPSGYTDIAAGAATSCGLAANSAMYCWGSNANGKFGDGTTTDSSVPVVVTTSGALSGKTIKSISATVYYHGCLIASDDNAYCWGDNANGGLGNGTTTSSSVPVAVTTSGALSGKTIKSIAVGAQHACAIASDNNAYCWGSNGAQNGYLGNNSTADSSVPVAVTTSGVLSGKTIKSISASVAHTCAIASDNNAYCWGSNTYGALGNGVGSGYSRTPSAVTTSGALSGKTIKSIAAGSSYACAVASDDNAYCWGYNHRGQLGDGTTTNSSVPVAVSTSSALSGKIIKSISAGQSHTCALASDNKAFCWGDNAAGQLGNGTTDISFIAVPVNEWQ